MPAASASTSLQPVPLLDFSREFAEIRDEVMAAIEAVCASQRFILGPQVAEFEAAAAQACGVAHAIGCASGTDALWLALAALGIGNSSHLDSSFFTPQQDAGRATVITTPFSFFASVSAILRAGARPVLADIDPRTFNLSPDSAREVMQQRGPVAAILPVHLFGQCADMSAFQTLTAEHGCRLVEDAAQAFGATWQGEKAGGLGDIAAFSFYPTKNLAAFGDAGMVTTQDAALAERATMLRAHGMRKRYFHDEVGWNCRLDSLQAAVLQV